MPRSTAPSSTEYRLPPPPQSTYSARPSTHSALSGYRPPRLGYTSSETSTSEYSASSSSISGPSLSPSLHLVAYTQRQSTSPNQPETSKAAEAGLLSVLQQATFHADSESGIRFDERSRPQPVAGRLSSANALEANDLADVPPSYTAS